MTAVKARATRRMAWPWAGAHSSDRPGFLGKSRRPSGLCLSLSLIREAQGLDLGRSESICITFWMGLDSAADAESTRAKRHKVFIALGPFAVPPGVGGDLPAGGLALRDRAARPLG